MTASIRKPKPFVSVVTPTYNRHKFLPWLVRMFNQQTYPQDRMELIILDDSPSEFGDINILTSSSKTQNNIRYIHHKGEKMSIGAKRNKLNELAKGDIIVCMDDDDYYPPCRVEHCVLSLERSGAHIAGSSIMYIYFADSKKILKFGPYGQFHATNGTFAFTKEYANSHKYDETVQFGEESSYTKNFTEPLVQMDPFKTILCISHNSNTFDKGTIKHQGAFTVAKLRDFVKDKMIRNFYDNILQSP